MKRRSAKAFDYIPERIKAFIQTHTQHWTSLRAIFTQPWVQTWEGWTRAATTIKLVADDDALVEEVARETLSDLVRLVKQNAKPEDKKDDKRREEVEELGKRIGKGYVHGSNECLADSLLQLLAHNGFVNPQLKEDTEESVAKRRHAWEGFVDTNNKRNSKLSFCQ